jgi:translation initiation factor IF-3
MTILPAANVRLVAADGSQRGIVSRAEALAEAKAAGLDLVLVAVDASPPVCKVMDYGKHLFELKKTKAAQRKKQKQIQVKEMKFRPGTEEGDYQVKLRNLKRFLEEGDKAKVSLRFRGREVVHPEIGMNLMTRIAEDLDELGSVESEPKFEGRQVIMVLAPRKNRKAQASKEVHRVAAFNPHTRRTGSAFEQTKLNRLGGYSRLEGNR